MHISRDTAVDLQMHTTYSDGRWTAEELFDHLAQEGFGLVAVTDHDRVDTVATIQELGRQKQIAVLTAVEISAAWQGSMADVLCFGFDPEVEPLRRLAERIRQQAAENAQEVYEELERRGYEFPHREEVLAARQGKLRVAWDCIPLLLKHGYVKDEASAFALIEEAGYHEIKAGLAETVEAAHGSGGVALIAHPGRGKVQPEYFTDFTLEMLDQIRAEMPLDGIEAYYPLHSPEQREMYLEYAKKYDLVVSAGSDSHGPPGRMPIKYKAELCQHLFERVGIEVR